MKARILLYIAFVMFTCSCSDIFEHNLSDDVVTIYGPANNTISQSYSQEYWWKEVVSATRYNLQIAKPSFDSTGTFVLDTIVTGTKVNYSLNPGTYQWRVRAENGSSHTNYTTYSIRIDTGSLANQTVVQLSPEDNFVTNNPALILKWQGLYGATQYDIVIDSASSTTLFNDTVISSNSFNPSINYAFSKDQTYFWKVRAGNGALNSNYSAFRTFTLDRIGPDSVPMPASSNTAQPNPLLQWGSVSDAYLYKVYIYKQPNGIDLLNGFPATVVSPTLSYSFTSGTAGTKYYWVAVAYDQAGNAGLSSKYRSFIVQ